MQLRYIKNNPVSDLTYKGQIAVKIFTGESTNWSGELAGQDQAITVLLGRGGFFRNQRWL